MGPRRRSQVLVAVLTLVALGWMTLDLGSVAGVTAAPRRMALTAFAPVQRLLATAVRPVDAGAAWLADQRRLHARLAALRDADADLRAATVANADLAAENDRLRALLAMAARHRHRTVGARLIGRPPGDPTGGVLITAGAARGVRPDMPVVDHRGMVGRVVQATDGYARVEPVTSPTARIAVRAGADDLPGRLQGGGGDALLRLELNDASATVERGAAVVTRTYEGSGIPDGLPIGTVVSAPDRGRDAAVRPVIGIDDADVVQVIVDGRVTADTGAGGGPARPGDGLPPPPTPGER